MKLYQATLAALSLVSIISQAVCAMREDELCVRKDDFVNIYNSSVADVLQYNPTITDLTLPGSHRYTLDDIQTITNNKNIAELTIPGSSLTPEHCEILGQSKFIKILHIDYNQMIGDDGLKCFANNKSIAELNVNDCNITIEGIKEIIKNKTIEALWICQKNIGTEEIALLLEGNFKKLWLDHWPKNGKSLIFNIQNYNEVIEDIEIIAMASYDRIPYKDSQELNIYFDRNKRTNIEKKERALSRQQIILFNDKNKKSLFSRKNFIDIYFE